LLIAVMLGSLAACASSTTVQEASPQYAAEARAAETASAWFPGKTQPAPGHVARIAPAVLHPVVDVLVQVGDRVKKGQPLIKLDDDEAQADVRAKKAALAEVRASLARLKEEPRREEQNEARAVLANVKIASEEASHLYDRLELLYRTGAVAEQRYHEARFQLARSKTDEAAAEARLARLFKRPFEREVAEIEARLAAAEQSVKSAEAELEHYTLVSQIDGVVGSIDVRPGTVSRPGTTVWGEVLDLSAIDVRCDLAPAQADALRAGQAAEVLLDGSPEDVLAGNVIVVGIAADPQTGRVPVLVRVTNAHNRLRCYVDIKVRLSMK
jgi:multidrug resistance efflux pump